MIETGPNQVNPATTNNFDPFYRNILPSGVLYHFSERRRKRLRIKYGNRCAICGHYGDCQCHHIFPKALGGARKDKNAVVLCGNCHRMVDEEWQNSGLIFDSAENGKPSYVDMACRMDLCSDPEMYNNNKARLIERERDRGEDQKLSYSQQVFP